MATQLADAEPVKTAPGSLVVRVALPGGFDGEAAYEQWVAGRVGEATQRARQAQNPLEQAHLLLWAANELLGHGLELGCTNTLLGLKDEDSKLEDAKPKLDRAGELIGEAQTVLESFSLGDRDQTTPDASDRAARLSEHLTTLRAFSKVLGVVLAGQEEPDGGDRAREAASALSRLREHDDPQVAAAAALWQAALRSREQDTLAARSMLDWVTAKLKPAALPFVFYGRLLRCQLIARDGGFAVASALLLQIEELCNEWFDDRLKLRQAAQTALLLRLHVLQSWRDGLASSETQARAWCDQQMEQLRQNHFQADSPGILRLSPAIPLIVPEVPHEAAAPPTSDNAPDLPQEDQ